MKRKLISQSIRMLALTTAVAASASVFAGNHSYHGYKPTTFNKLSTFDVMAGNGTDVAEIIDVTRDGEELVYTDSETGQIGFVDISNPAKPIAGGTVVVGGEPTSLVVRGRHVLVGVNTSESFTEPSGKLVVVDHVTRSVVAEFELGGQPDSLALAPNKRTLAIVIENERDEDLNGGFIPQTPENPTGALLIVKLKGKPSKWEISEADFSPVAASAPAGDDLEPEYVDINKKNEAVVTFQENNYIAIVNMKTGKVVNHFSAGTAQINNVDSAEEDLINFNTSLNKRREPDSVTWINDNLFATANEGDYEDESGEGGGSRSFTIFHKGGYVQYESGESFEHWLASAGHYNEGRSENKGCEPEGIESAKYGRRNLLFVGSERCNAVGVYDVTHGTPQPLQLLPTGIGPEGLKAIAKKGLFVASTEKDEAGDGIPTMVNIFEAQDKRAKYPMIQSVNDLNGAPIPWVALSGMVGDIEDKNTIYAVSDSFLAEGFIYTIKTGKPAKIVDRVQVTGASQSLDLEGIAQGPDGNFWLGSEGNDGSRLNLVLKTAPDGTVLEEVNLPAGLEVDRRKNGIEGIAVTGEAGAEIVYVAIQRAWPNSAGGDVDKVTTKIGRYSVATGEWGFVHYPLEAEGNGGWIGLSELTALPNGDFTVIERDKGWGPTTGPIAELKAIFGIDLASADFRAYDDPQGLVTIEKSLLQDVKPNMEKRSIWTAEKLEGMAVTANGKIFVVTDNDGIDDAPGETLFFRLGKLEKKLGLRD